jgi:hypothetical protein
VVVSGSHIELFDETTGDEKSRDTVDLRRGLHCGEMKSSPSVIGLYEFI